MASRNTLSCWKDFSLKKVQLNTLTGPSLQVWPEYYEVGLSVSIGQENQFHAMVKTDLVAVAKQSDTGEKAAEFAAGYESKYEYGPGVLEEQLTALLDQEAYQYMLVVQSFPLAMTHFRRELQSFGVDARELPLGL